MNPNLRYDVLVGSRIDIKELRTAIMQYKTEMRAGMGDVKLIDGAQLKSSVSQFRTQFRSSVSGMVDDAKAPGEAYIDSLGRARDANGKFIKGAGADFDNLKKQTGGIGEGLAGALKFVAITETANRLSGMIQSISGPLLKLDTQIKNIGTLAPTFDGQALSLDKFKDKIIDLSTEVPDSADVIAGGVYDAISAGIVGTEDQIIDFVKVASQAAVAGQTNTQAAVNGLTSVMNAYKLSVDKAGEVSSTFFGAVKLGKLSFEELNSSLANVVPAASAAGISFKEIAGIYAQMTSLGVPAAQASTQMRAAIIEIQKPGADLAKVMKGVIVEIDGVQQALTENNVGQVLKQQGLTATLQQIAVSANGMGKSVTQAFSSSEAASAALLVTGENAEMANKMIAGVQNEIDANAAVAAFDIAATGIEARVGLVVNKVQAFIARSLSGIGDFGLVAANSVATIAPTIAQIAASKELIPDSLIESTGKKLKGIGKDVANSELIKTASGRWQGFFTSLGKMKDRALTLGGKAVDLIPPSLISKASSVFGGITKLGGAFVGKIAAFGKAAASALLGPWGLAIAGVALALAYFFTQTETGRAVFEKIKTYAIAAFEFVKTAILAAGNVLAKIFKGDFSGAVDEAKKGFGDAVNSFKDSVANSGLQKSIEDATTIKNDLDKNDKLGDLITKFEGAQGKLDAAIASGADKSTIDQLRKDAEVFGGAISKIMPQAVEGVESFTDAQGKVTTQYKINTQSAKGFVDAQKKAYQGDLKKTQKDFVAGLQNQVQQYERNKKRLGELQVKITTAKPEDVGPLLKEFNDLQATVNENRDALAGTFEQGKKLGLVGDDVRGIATQFGLSTENADKLQKTVDEVADTTKKAVRSADDLAASFDGALKAANENLTKTASAAAQLAVEGKKNSAEYKDLVKSGIEERKNRDRLLQTQKQVNVALGIEKVEGKSAFERAKARYDLENDRLDVTVTQFEIDQETARIASKREKTTKDDLALAQKKLDALRQQKRALEDSFKIDATGQIGVRVTADEKAEVDKMVSGLNLELAKQQNSVADLVVKVGLDAEALQKQFRDLRRSNLEFEVRVGVTGADVLVADLEQELQKTRLEMNLDPNLDEKGFLALSDKEKQLEAQLSQIRQDARDKEFNQFKSQSDRLFDYEKARIERESELRTKAVERQQRVFDLMLKSFDAGQTKNTDSARDRSIKAVDDEKEARLKALQETEDAQVQSLQSLNLENSEKAETAIRKKHEKQRQAIEEESVRNREALEAQYQARVAANAALARGVQIVADREYEDKKLRMQLDALEQEKEAMRQRAAINEAFLQAQRVAAEQAGDLDSVRAIDAALRELGTATNDAAGRIDSDMQRITKTIQENGDAGIIVTEQLADTLGDALGAFAANNVEGVKEAFRGLFGVVAGALTRMASAAILQVLFTPQAVAEYASLGFGAPAGFLALKLLLDGLVGKFLTPLIANMLAFPTGGVFNSPTLAVVGDASRLGGSNTEFLLRDDQLRENTKAALASYDSTLGNELRAIRSLLENLQLSVNLDMRRLTVELSNARGAKNRRRF